MFNEDKCPFCGCGDYEVQDYEENSQDDYFARNWGCKCSDCKSFFTISYLYELKKIEVS